MTFEEYQALDQEGRMKVRLEQMRIICLVPGVEVVPNAKHVTTDEAGLGSSSHRVRVGFKASGFVSRQALTGTVPHVARDPSDAKAPRKLRKKRADSAKRNFESRLRA